MMAGTFGTKAKILQPPTFKAPARRSAKAQAATRVPVLPTDEHLPTTIQGKPVGSLNEARVGVCLDYLQQRYRYQVPINYGRERAGGQVLDFLVVSFRPYTVVDVRGEYWHTGKHEDSLSMQKVVQDRHWNLVVVWGKDSATVDQTLSFLRANLPYG